MQPRKIVIHNSATRDSGTVSWGAIRRYHVSYAYQGRVIDKAAALRLIDQGKRVKKPWSDVGYHFGIEQVGSEFEILLGRMADKQGAHCRAGGLNTHSVGICCVGDFDNENIPPEQWDKCLELTRYLMRQLGLSRVDVIGHREVESRKTCPGRRFDMDAFRAAL